MRGCFQEFRSQTDQVISPLVSRGRLQPVSPARSELHLATPLELPVVARKITDRLSGALNGANRDLAKLVRVAMDELDMAYIPADRGVVKPPADMAGYLERLVKAIRHANSERAAVLSVLDKDEIDFLYSTEPQTL